MTRHAFTPSTGRVARSRAHDALTPEQRSESAKKAAAARWRKEKGEDWTAPADDVALTAFYAEVDEKWPGLASAARTAQAEALRRAYRRGGAS